MVALAASASFLAAFLLFAVQPMAAKMALPLLGGSASVWTVCMLFFQCGLLAGYGWAHILGSRTSLGRQILLHAALLAASLFVLPPVITARALPEASASPAPWLLSALTLAFGLPYAALAATAPLVQRWISETTHPSAADPYFLYAASNAGSFAGLAAYPFVLERFLPLGTGLDRVSQSSAWSVGFVVLAVLLGACGIAALRYVRPETRSAEAAEPASWPVRWRWVALAFVPSSAVLGATQYLTSNVAAVPLFWVVPLALYLATFVIAFSPRVRLSASSLGRALGIVLLLGVAEFQTGTQLFGLGGFAIHLVLVALIGLLCHGRLAASRPDRALLTEYYLWISLGGCAGGVFNALVAPHMFDSIAEYPLIVGLAALLVPDPARALLGPRDRLVGWALDAAAALGVEIVALLVWRLLPLAASGTTLVALTTLIPLAGVAALLPWPRRFAWAACALLAVMWVAVHSPSSALHRDRTFYGVHQVVEVPRPGTSESMHVLIDGSTRHGAQLLDPRGRRMPTSYYHPSGPLGDIVRGMRARGPLSEIAVIGLGAGAIAAYGCVDENVTFFEIDPAVARIAREPRWFDFLSDSAAHVTIVIGDGRRCIGAYNDGRFDLIVLDAFSSDAIPVHLLTREAVGLYLRKLKPGGCLAIHLTNRYLTLDPVVGAIATALRIPAALRYDTRRTPQQLSEAKENSKWAVLGEPGPAGLPVSSEDGWSPLSVPDSDSPEAFLWTDERSNVVPLFSVR